MNHVNAAMNRCFELTMKAIFEPDDVEAKRLIDESGRAFVEFVQARSVRAAGVDPDELSDATEH